MLDYGIEVLGITPIGKAVGTGIRLGDNLIGAAAKVAGTGAENAANGLKLNKSLASQAQMGEAGKTMAGAGSLHHSEIRSEWLAV